MLRISLILVCVLALAAPAIAGGDGGGTTTTNIMRPEPATAPPRRARKPAKHDEATEPKSYGVKQDSRRGSSNPVYPAPSPGPQAPAAVPHMVTPPPPPPSPPPPPLYVPETGRSLPNLPVTGAGAETSQDRATRCAHQAGVYGPSATGNPNSYIGSCINQ
jgi:hypothetical protein